MPKACWRRCTILTIDLSKIIINTFWPNANSNPPFNFNIVGIEMRNKINKIEASPTTNKFYGGSNYINFVVCVCVCSQFTVLYFWVLNFVTFFFAMEFLPWSMTSEYHELKVDSKLLLSHWIHHKCASHGHFWTKTSFLSFGLGFSLLIYGNIVGCNV